MVEQAKSAREETTMTHLETVQAIIHQLDKRHGIYADLVSDTHQEPPLHGVNVWIDHHDRYPSDTAWVSDEVVTWGPNYEHELPADTDPAEIADQLKATVKPRP